MIVALWFFILVVYGGEKYDTLITPLQFGPFHTLEQCEYMRTTLHRKLIRVHSLESFPCWSVQR